MLIVTGLSHICVNVDSIEDALTYYRSLLGARPFQIFPNFKNEGFAKNAGFGQDWTRTEVSIAFMTLPGNVLTLELMEYHSPAGQTLDYELATTDKGRVGHIALKVSGIDSAFNHVQSHADARLISDAPDYRPEQISQVSPNEFRFFDIRDEEDPAKKQLTAKIVSGIRFFYFVDRYGIQWECEEGHDDIGGPIEA